MSDSSNQCCSNPKRVLSTLLIFALFGFLALILTGRLGSKNPENRAYQGEFTAEATKLRWTNLEEVRGAQTALVDAAKVNAALEALAKAPAKPAATEVVVPGSPTFLKQMEQQAAPAAPAPAAPAPAAPAGVTPAPTTPAPTAPAPPAAAPQAAPAKPASPAPATPAAPKAAPAPAAAPPAPAIPAPVPPAKAPQAAPAPPANPAPAPAPAPAPK